MRQPTEKSQAWTMDGLQFQDNLSVEYFLRECNKS